MPASRTNNFNWTRALVSQLRSHTDFEDLDGDPTHVKCLGCSAASDTQDTIILRAWRKGHLATRKHIDAVAATQAAPEVQNPRVAQQPEARFQLSEMLLDSGSEDDRAAHRRTHGALEDILMDGNQFFDADRNEIFFSAGTEETRTAQRQELLEGIWNLDYYDHTVFGEIDQEDLTVSSAVTTLVEMGLESDSDDKSEAEYSPNDRGWNPHGSKTLKTIIWVMRECRTPDVPSFSALRKKQAQLTKDVNIQTTHHISAMGNEFYMNHPAELLALDWANPLVWEFMQVYPEITDNISEFNHTDKWTKEVDLDDLSPMWADWKKAGHKHFYVKELAQLKNGKFVIPMRWGIFNKEEYAEVHNVIHYPEEANYSFKFPVRKIAKGRPVFSVRIIPWSDNVSGNVSQEYFIRFCSTSPHASSGEQFEALAEDLAADKYHEAYDCELEQEILFRIFAHVLPADNPQQAESASNAGVHANLWYRYDMTGGTAAHRETEAGYRALFKIWAACAGVQEVVDELQTSTDLIQWELYNWVILQPEGQAAKDSANHQHLRPGDHYNILLRVRGLDPHRDSPCEILHSILLGDDKYIWHETNTPWDKSKGDTFAVRLQSSSTNGLNLSSVRDRYIVKYKNGLIGKHFKILQQLGAFHLHEDLCGKNLFDLWKASGKLRALLWFPEIRNREQYLIDVQVCIDNVLDIWAVIDPARIMTKYKLHVLPHLPDDILRFGPPILYATEGFEGWNSVFRLCSILSNHQAPSHNIGITLADMEQFKHQVSGGWWRPSGSQEYVQAGHEVNSFLDNNKELQRRLGWMDKSKPNPDGRGEGKVWTTCKYVISQAGDVCTNDSFVFFKCKDTDNVLTGCISLIVIPVTATTAHHQAIVVIRQFVVSATRDVRLNMPVLSPTAEIKLAQPGDILFFFNAQHDCYGLKCQAVTGAENIIQERNITGRTQTAVQHKPTEIYHINMHTLHNAHLLRDILPRSLTAPISYFLDRDAKHDKFSTQIRVSGPAKCAATAKKSKETRKKKKQAKAVGGRSPRRWLSQKIRMRRKMMWKSE
ncbi:hypothetical protein DFH09DRAFT_1068977 [Mycena vulgaris]|nr:hypothetical protein DFH09DRAFT_1068977 [Mycena vulgaris]